MFVQYTEPFVFIWSNLHNETKRQSWTTPRSMKHGDKMFAQLHASLQSMSITQILYQSLNWNLRRFRSLWSQSKISYIFSSILTTLTNLHEIFSFRFFKSSIYSLIFWFFAQMQKDLNEKRSCKYSWPFWILSWTSKSSLFPGLLDHKMLWALWKSIAFDHAVVKQEKKTQHKILK